MNEQKIIKSFLLADAKNCSISPEKQKAMLSAILLNIGKSNPQPKTI